jgi:class 3 adenylate cyclase
VASSEAETPGVQPKTDYARSGDLHIAYQCLGEGPVNLVFVARVAAHAGPGEVLASRTVKDLVAGSGIQFEDRGVQRLKGIPDEWQLFSVKRDADSGV